MTRDKVFKNSFQVNHARKATIHPQCEGSTPKVPPPSGGSNVTKPFVALNEVLFGADTVEKHYIQLLSRAIQEALDSGLTPEDIQRIVDDTKATL